MTLDIRKSKDTQTQSIHQHVAVRSLNIEETDVYRPIERTCPGFGLLKNESAWMHNQLSVHPVHCVAGCYFLDSANESAKLFVAKLWLQACGDKIIRQQHVLC